MTKQTSMDKSSFPGKFVLSPNFKNIGSSLVSSHSHRTIKRDVYNKMKDLENIFNQLNSVPKTTLSRLDADKVDEDLRLFELYMDVARQQEDAHNSASHTAACNCLEKAYEEYALM